LSKPENLDNPARFEELMHELELLSDEDSQEDRVFFSDLFHELFTLFSRLSAMITLILEMRNFSMLYLTWARNMRRALNSETGVQTGFRGILFI